MFLPGELLDLTNYGEEQDADTAFFGNPMNSKEDEKTHLLNGQKLKKLFCLLRLSCSKHGNSLGNKIKKEITVINDILKK